jgi:hypothetical protein
MCDISPLPVFPKVIDANIGTPAVSEDRSEGFVRAVSDADERPKDVEREELCRQRSYLPGTSLGGMKM